VVGTFFPVRQAEGALKRLLALFTARWGPGFAVEILALVWLIVNSAKL